MSINPNTPVDEPIESEVAEVTLSEDEAPVAAPEADGQVEATEQTSEDQAPEPKYLDLTQYEDHLVKVKINGEEVEVPASDLPDGFMRHGDYTQKTQELAFWRQVDQAMRNPETAGEALKYLAQTFGVEVAQQVAEQAEAEEEEYSDPVERRLAQIEASMQAQTAQASQAQAVEYLNQVVTNLSSKYEDFDGAAVVTEAVNRGIHDPGQLEDVYKLMQFDRIRVKNDAQASDAQRRAAEEAARRTAAQQVANVTNNGGSASGGGASVAPTNTRPTSIREAFAAAKAAQGA